MATWNAGFEATPVASDPISQGPTKIDQFKQETRFRAEPEHKWGPSVDLSGEGAADNGRHRVGSARIFCVNSAPTQLVMPDYAGGGSSGGGSILLDRGRLWADTTATVQGNSSYTLNVYDTTDNLWHPIVAEPVSGFTTLVASQTNSGATVAIPVAPAAANNVFASAASVAVPATGSYVIRVTGGVDFANPTNASVIYVGLTQFDGTTTTRPRIIKALIAAGLGGHIEVGYVFNGPTNSLTYAYNLEILSSAAAAIFNPNFGAYVTTGSASIAEIQVTLDSKSQIGA